MIKNIGGGIMKRRVWLLILALGVVFAGCEAVQDLMSDGQGLVVADEKQETSNERLGYRDVDLTDVEIYDYLMLINRQNRARAINEQDLSAAWPTVPVSVIDGMLLHHSALWAVAEMFDEARAAGFSGLFVSSGFKGLDEQERLYDNGRNVFALPPGYSEHHTGLAVDIMATGVSQVQLAGSEQGRWMAENSWRFGLILRYPEDKQDVTGVPFEPWHFRYVGKAHAYFMFQNRVVLEEYIEMVRNDGVVFDFNGVEHFVLHTNAQNGIIEVPDGMDFSIYTDNLGGFIIMVRR